MKVTELQHRSLVEELMRVRFKDGVNPYDLRKVHAHSLLVLKSVKDICHVAGFPLEVTRVIDLPIAGLSKSNTHAGRAIDVSVRRWDQAFLDHVLKQVNSELAESVGAMSFKDGINRAALYEYNEKTKLVPTLPNIYARMNGAVEHLHLQCAPTDGWRDLSADAITAMKKR